MAKGEEFVITVKGDPIVLRVPEPAGRPAPDAAVQALREARRGVRLGGIPVRELIDQGRR